MKIWLIGKKGMLGRELYEYLKKKNCFVIATSKEEVDIADKKKVFHFYKRYQFSTIINASGYTDVEKAEDEVDGAYQVNAKGPENLYDLSENFPVKIIHFSTDYVFDGKKSVPYSEDDFCNPINIYGKSKREGEVFLLKNPENLIIRTSWLIGNGKNFIRTIYKKIYEEKMIKVVCDQVGRLTFVQDLVHAVWRLLPFKGIFHMSNQGIAGWHEIAEKILSLSKGACCRKIVPVLSEELFLKAKRPKYSVLSIQKMENIYSIPYWEDRLEEYLKRRVL